MPYTVIVNENSHYMDDAESYTLGEFPTCDEALSACRAMVDEDINNSFKEGISADDLYLQYTSFGRDPYIVSSDTACKFSAWTYAKERAAALTAPPLTLADWFIVTLDADSITLDVSPPGGTPWQAKIEWNTINRICLKTGDLLTPDEIYIFTTLRAESHLIPMEASGGLDLWDEIITRGLFDAELAITAAATQNELFCNPS